MLPRLRNRKRIAVVLFLLLRYYCHESLAQPKQNENVCLFDGKIFQPGESLGELFEIPRYEERTTLLVALVTFYYQPNMAFSYLLEVFFDTRHVSLTLLFYFSPFPFSLDAEPGMISRVFVIYFMTHPSIVRIVELWFKVVV
jgi:hypothetical protein